MSSVVEPEGQHKPWWKKKRYNIPGGILVSLIIIGSCGPDPVPATQSPQPVTTVTVTVSPSGSTTEAPPTPVESPSEAPTPTPVESPKPESDRVTVVRVSDGDTIRVAKQFGLGKEFSVRIIGIDTPETVDPRKPEMCGGREASNFAKKKLENATVDLVFDPSQGKKDKFGRTLAYVEVDGGDYGLMALKAGHAAEYTYRTPYVRQKAYRAAMKAAKAANKGLWGHCSGISDPIEPEQPEPTKTAPPAPSEPVYANCTAVREAGKAPIRRGQPGYSSRLDRDGDGIACDQ